MGRAPMVKPCVMATLQVDPGVLLLALPADAPKPLGSGKGELRDVQAPGAGPVQSYPPQRHRDGYTAGSGHWALVQVHQPRNKVRRLTP